MRDSPNLGKVEYASLDDVVDGNFQPRFTIRTDGIPSRARISPDGRYAAFTVFLTGHSYSDTQLSTATLLVNMEQGRYSRQPGTIPGVAGCKVIKSLDFNYWGVTFQTR